MPQRREGATHNQVPFAIFWMKLPEVNMNPNKRFQKYLKVLIFHDPEVSISFKQ